MHAMAARLGFDLVSLRLELFGRRREAARARPASAAPDERQARRARQARAIQSDGERSATAGRSRDDRRKPSGRRPQPTGRFAELRAGNLGVRLAANAAEIDAVQALRYRVFYQELGADGRCRHVRVAARQAISTTTVADHCWWSITPWATGPEGVVGTYRLIQREAARGIGHFYSAGRIRHRPDRGAFPAGSWNSAAPASTPATATAR